MKWSAESRAAVEYLLEKRLRFVGGLLVACVVLSPLAGTAAGRRRKAPSHHPRVSLGAAIQQILANPDAARAHWGISVVTTEGKPLFALNDGQFFEPASNAKLFTTAATLGLIPSSATWTTVAVTSGSIGADGTLTGDVRLLGAGDPTISGRSYPWDGKTERPNSPLQGLQNMADQIVAAGVHHITGDVIGDDAWFPWERYGANWAWDDLQWEYGAPASALTINDNVQYLDVTPAPEETAVPAPSQPAAGTIAAPAPAPGTARPTVVAWNPDVPYYTLENELVLAPPGVPAHSGIDRAPGSLTVRLFGAVSPNGMHDALAIEDPAQFAALALRQMLLARGVTVDGKAEAAHRLSTDTEEYRDEVTQAVVLRPLTLTTIQPPDNGLRVLATHVSPTLGEDVTVTNKVSQNLHAELYLRLLGRLEGEDGSIAQGARVVRQFLIQAGIDPGDFLFFDGSGMSSADLITPRAATALLVYAAHQPWGGLYKSTLPVGGVDGTLADRFAGPLRGRIFAKTGTLAEVNTLSGYLVGASGKTVVFSVLCNDRQPSGNAARQALDRIVTAIAERE
jgi:D-alanyl-D-alanine carboxypeptidase/D-alanyl-D-alanine-endopeptidase (penicillin-binding protein 4)